MSKYHQKQTYAAPESEVVVISQEASIADGLSQQTQLQTAEESDYGEF